MKKLFLLAVALLMGSMTVAIMARINYVPLYIVDPDPDVTTTRKGPSAPMFITQNDYKLLLPEFDDQMTIKLIKDAECVYEEAWQSIVDLPTTLVGDYEVRLCAEAYYYHGYISLGELNGTGIPTETENWENITLLGSNTSLEVLLNNLMELSVVVYNEKRPTEMSEHELAELETYPLSDLEKEEYIRAWEEMQAELRAQRNIGLLVDEVMEQFPYLVDNTIGDTPMIKILQFIPVLICCIQELKIQLDSRTEAVVDAMMSRGLTTTAYNAVRSAIGNTLLSAAPTSVNEPAVVRYLLTNETNNAHITVTDMSGRVLATIPVSPYETSVSIDSRLLGEGVFLCTLNANGTNISTKRLVKTK